MALHADPERDAEVESLLVRQAELFGELMDPDLSCHVRVQPFIRCSSVLLIGREPPAGGGRRRTSLSGFRARHRTAPHGAEPRRLTPPGPGTPGRRPRGARRRSRHAGDPAQSHAPRAGATGSATNSPVRLRAIRTSSTCGARRRQPTHVRSGSPAPARSDVVSGRAPRPRRPRPPSDGHDLLGRPRPSGRPPRPPRRRRRPPRATTSSAASAP